MAFESNNFNVVKKAKLTKGEFNVECNVSLGAPIQKVLSVSTEACVLSSEVLNGNINYAGAIDVKIVFCTEDGEIGMVNSTCPFSSKFEGEMIANGQKAILCVKVIDQEVEAMGSDSVRIVCTLEQSGSLVSVQEIHSIRSDDADICTKNAEINIIKFIGEQSETVTVKSEFSVREPIKRVLLTESQVVIKSVESGVNFVTVSGEVVSRVLYLTEENKFESGYINDSFKEELELDGATRDSQVEAYAYVKRDQVKTEVESSDKGVKLNIEVPFVLNAKAYEQTCATVIQDLYSTTSEIKVSTESFDMTAVCPMEFLESKIDGSLTLEEDKPRVDKIMFVGGNSVVISNAYIKDGEINIEGIAKTNVVYLNDEQNNLNSVQIDVPFVISDKFDVEDSDGILMVDAIVCDVDVVVKKGREFYYDAKIKACANYCHIVVSGVITEASLLEAYPEKDYGMELLFAKAGQDAWDIAKEARIKEDQLIGQNPEVIFPLQEDKNLILFYQKAQG